MSMEREKHLSKFIFKKMLILITGVILAQVGAMSARYIKGERTASVTVLAWQTVIDIEKYKEVSTSDWVLPDDAELITTRIETKEYKKVLEYYKKEYIEERTGPYGITTSELQDVPVYKWLKIEAPKYYYKQMQWVHERVAMKEGTGHKLQWAAPGLADDEREGSRETHYYVELDIDGETNEYNVDEGLFSQLNKGDQIKCTIDGSTVVKAVKYK